MKRLVQPFVAMLSIFFSIMAFAQVPDVMVRTIDNQSVSLRSLVSERPNTVVCFWATWCAPCKKELDAISEVYDSWQKNYDADLVAISVDDARATAKVKPMVSEKGWPFTIVIDSNQALMRALNFQSVPFTVIFDREGTIVYRRSGYLPGDEEEIEAKLKSLVQP